MSKTIIRSNCPITIFIDVLGDKWSLLIMRDMLFNHTYTFGQLIEMKEGIASKILSIRLKTMASNGLIEKRNHPTNKKVFLYTLTDKGISTIEVFYKIIKFSIKFYRNKENIIQKNIISIPNIDTLANSEEIFIKNTKLAYIKFRKKLSNL